MKNNKYINRYILGDCFDVLPKIKDKSVNLVFTSIPDFDEINITNEKDYQDFLEKLSNAITRVVSDTGFMVMCQTDRKLNGKIYLKHLKICSNIISNGFIVKDYKILVKDKYDKINLFRLNFSHIMIFTKMGTIKHKYKEYLKDIWLSKLPKNKNFFGEDFCSTIIENLTKENDFIVDPFAGRGTVIKVAKKLNRKYLGIEINKNIYDNGNKYINE